MKIKQIIIIAGALLVSVASFAQKDELKALKKIYSKEVPSANDMAEYKTNIAKLETLATEEGDKVYTNFYKCMLPLLEVISAGQRVTPALMANAFSSKSITDLALGLNATLDYEKKIGKKVYTDDINETIKSYKPQFIALAFKLGENKKNKEAGDVFYAVYLLDKKDQDVLYFAASYAVNGQDYDKALDYYTQLKTLNYTGEKTIYWATNIASHKEEQFQTVAQRQQAIQTGVYEKPRNEKLESNRGEIYKNIALILVSKGKTAEAIAAVQEARKENPNDESLILTEADLYLKLKDYDNYTKCVNEALAKNPNNAELNFNLGVISSNAGKLVDAEKYYRKALEINPNYFDANLNLGELLIRPVGKIEEEMNNLGVSEKDNKRFDVLKSEKTKILKSALPYYEKAVELQPDNEDLKKDLLSVYNALEMTDKYKALKAKM